MRDIMVDGKVVYLVSTLNQNELLETVNALKKYNKLYSYIKKNIEEERNNEVLYLIKYQCENGIKYNFKRYNLLMYKTMVESYIINYLASSIGLDDFRDTSKDIDINNNDLVKSFLKQARILEKIFEITKLFNKLIRTKEKQLFDIIDEKLNNTTDTLSEYNNKLEETLELFNTFPEDVSLERDYESTIERILEDEGSLENADLDGLTDEFKSYLEKSIKKNNEKILERSKEIIDYNKNIEDILSSYSNS